MNDENRNLYAPKRDIVIQTYGMKKTVHIIYPFFPIRQSDLDQRTKFDTSLTNRSSLAEADLKSLNLDLDYLLFGDSQLLFRPLRRVRTDSYFVLNYNWLYQELRNWNHFQYKITNSEENDAVESKENPIPPSNEKTTQSKLLVQTFPCKNFKKYSWKKRHHFWIYPRSTQKWSLKLTIFMITKMMKTILTILNLLSDTNIYQANNILMIQWPILITMTS